MSATAPLSLVTMPWKPHLPRRIFPRVKRLSPLARRTPASPSDCAVVSVDGGRPDLVCVVDDEE